MRPDSSSDVHVSTALYHIPFDLLWSRLTDPSQFPRLYPNWTAGVDREDDLSYLGVGPDGDTFRIIPRLHRDHGVIDFEILAQGRDSESSRSRLFPLEHGSCLYVHVATRWSGLDDELWEDFKRSTDEDMENARRVLEEDWPAT